MKEYKLTSLAQFGIDLTDTQKVKELLSSAPGAVVDAFKQNFGPVMVKLGL